MEKNYNIFIAQKGFNAAAVHPHKMGEAARPNITHKAISERRNERDDGCRRET